MALTLISSVVNFSSHGSGSDIILCRDSERTSGNFFYWASSGSADGGTIYNGSTGVWKMMYEGPISIKWFGALHGGIDCTAFIQSAINCAALSTGEVFVPQGVFYVENSVTIKLGVRVFYGPGSLFFNGTIAYTGA